MDQVAGRKHAGPCGPQRRVDQWAEAAAIELAARHHRQLVVRNPIRGENHEVAIDRPRTARLELGELDGLDPFAPWIALTAVRVQTGAR